MNFPVLDDRCISAVCPCQCMHLLFTISQVVHIRVRSCEPALQASMSDGWVLRTQQWRRLYACINNSELHEILYCTEDTIPGIGDRKWGRILACMWHSEAQQMHHCIDKRTPARPEFERIVTQYNITAGGMLVATNGRPHILYS